MLYTLRTWVGREIGTVEAEDVRGALLALLASGADLSGADLRRANLSDADLSGADLSFNLVTPAPDLAQQIAQIVLAEPKRLRMDMWHTCETTHCLAGWAIALTPGAAALEEATSPFTAGTLLLPAAAHLFYDGEATVLGWLRDQLPDGDPLK